MISVLIPVYKNEKATNFDLAILSIYNQTYVLWEIILVADGPLTGELEEIVEKWSNLLDERFQVVRLPHNVGVAKALNAGLKRCSGEIVARMDSDDFCEPYRLHRQICYMLDHADVDVVGSYVSEFVNDVDKPISIKKVPEQHQDITRIMWFQNPINHMTVMFKKSSVLRVGGYEPFYGDDDHLWAKMYVDGCRFHNIPECLVRVRVGEGMVVRRGMRWLAMDIRVRRYLLRERKMNLIQFIFVSGVLVLLRGMPTYLRKQLYSRMRAPIEDDCLMKSQQ